MRRPLLVLSLLSLGACAHQEHLGPEQGKAVRSALRAQTLRPEAGEDAKPIPGLDPQEASIVVDNYFRSLSPAKGAQTRKSPILILDEPEESKLPPPMGGPK